VFNFKIFIFILCCYQEQPASAEHLYSIQRGTRLHYQFLRYPISPCRLFSDIFIHWCCVRIHFMIGRRYTNNCLENRAYRFTRVGRCADRFVSQRPHLIHSSYRGPTTWLIGQATFEHFTRCVKFIRALS
jgi:hypothetical protein